MNEEGNSYFINSLTIQGFRAYLKSKTFDFSSKRSLAVFAPNASGKSSTIDALEFIFSENGTLDHLGSKTTPNQAGPGALEHYLAEEENVNAEVLIKFQKGNLIFEDKRNASRRDRTNIPEEALKVKACFLVNPIIRGYALRKFVEGMSPAERYVEIAGWLQLDPLVTVQQNLKKLLSGFKVSTEDNSAFIYLNKQVAIDTKNMIPSWAPNSVVSYINTQLLAPLDTELEFNTLSESDPTFTIVKTLATDEEQRLGLPSLRHINQSLLALYTTASDETTDNSIVGGLLNDFDQAAFAMQAASKQENSERNKTANTLFTSFWQAARPLFMDGMPVLNDCPLCETPLSNSPIGRTIGVKEHILVNMQELQGYAQAQNALSEATTVIARTHSNLISHIDQLLPLLVGNYSDLYEALSDYQDNNKKWINGEDTQNWTGLATKLLEVQARTAKDIENIESRQGENTYTKAFVKIENFMKLKKQHDDALRTQQERQNSFTELNSQSTFIATEIRKKMQSLLDSLQEPINKIYGEIQGDKARRVEIKLPLEDGVNQQQLFLQIDFADNRKGVQPSGYLSDSQIHSLALALRLSAIKLFNTGAPFIALDDIVTSYDANHRLSLAKMLNNHFTNFQLIIMTHDKRFFSYLKDIIQQKDWRYLCITRLEADFGPYFTDHKVPDELIEQRFFNNESAANEMRQAEEEWLYKRCQEFGVDARIRSTEEPYNYSRSELAEALQRYLNKNNLVPPLIPNINNPFLATLQKGNVENFGSHFQANEHEDSSVGDERVRWEDFKVFRDKFSCSKCSGKLFKHPFGSPKPICAYKKCNTPFEFSK